MSARGAGPHGARWRAPPQPRSLAARTVSPAKRPAMARAKESSSDSEDDVRQLPLLSQGQLLDALRAEDTGGGPRNPDYERLVRELRRVRPRDIHLSLRAARVAPTGDMELHVELRLGA